MEYLIGIDLGGTNIVCGLIDQEGSVIDTLKRSTGEDKSPDSVLTRVKETIDSLLENNGLTIDSILTIGMGSPGGINPEKGICLSSANLGWRNEPVVEKLQEKIGKPVYIDNDVRMYVYGEALKGAGRNYEHAFGLTIGTGIAAAFVKDRELHYGGGFVAGEIGHIPMQGLDELCKCGGIGCLETVVSGPGIARLATKKIEQGNKSILTDWYGDLSQITAADVTRAYDENDRVAKEVIHEVATYLARSLSYAIPILSPDVVIIGGGAAYTGERLLKPLRSELQKIIRSMYSDRVKICNALLIEDAGIIGSALFAKRQNEAKTL